MGIKVFVCNIFDKKRGWLCKVCAEYSKGTEQWKTVVVKLHEHPTRTFLGHENSKKYINALEKQREVRKILTKGTIYKQMIDGGKGQTISTRERNRRVIKKFMKTAYVAKKNWAVRENFPDTIDFVGEFPDEDIVKNFQGASSRATYASKISANEFMKCLSGYLEEGFKNRLLAASDVSLMTDETTDISDHAELAIFVSYLNSDSHQVTEEFLGLVEVYVSKGAEALFNLICNVLKRKGIDIKQMRFNGMDQTNTMSGERSRLQRRFRDEVPHTKYINCRNHKLALVFVHLLPNIMAL